MAHFSEMDFLFNNIAAVTDKIKNSAGYVAGELDKSGKNSIFSTSNDSTKYFVYKGPWGKSTKLPADAKHVDDNNIPKEKDSGNKNTNEIRNYTKNTIYNKDRKNNPYVDLINDFNGEKSAKSLTIRPSDLAYLRELGVHPINRMVILRRFGDGTAVPEKLDELDTQPISVVVGWLKPDENFGEIAFNESWTTTNNRLDELIGKIVKENFAKDSKLKSIMPVPSFARGLLFSLLKQAGFGGEDSPWDWDNIPIGDPNVLMEGPYRDPNNQNLKSSFNFTLDTTYEQKFIGDVDPGAAMIDIIDNLLKMGTSNMKYWLNGESGIMKDAKTTIMTKGGDDLNYWYNLLTETTKAFFKVIHKTISNIGNYLSDVFNGKISLEDTKELLVTGLQTILTSTIAKYRWELKGSLELMTGRDSVTPWFLTIGNPYSPWLASNHITVTNVKIETSNEVGFNDMPMWLKVTIACNQSRNLGRNEIIRMFNNSYLREYSNSGDYKRKHNDKPSGVDDNNPVDNNSGSNGTKSSDEHKQEPPPKNNYGSAQQLPDWLKNQYYG